MSPSTLTIQIDNKIKQEAQKKIKEEGGTLTFLITQLLKSYNEEKIDFRITTQQDEEYLELSSKLSLLVSKHDCKESLENQLNNS